MGIQRVSNYFSLSDLSLDSFIHNQYSSLLPYYDSEETPTKIQKGLLPTNKFSNGNNSFLYMIYYKMDSFILLEVVKKK